MPSVTQEVPTEDERKWSLILAFASLADVLCSSIIAGVAFKFAYRAVGASLYCLAIQAISHLLSSLLLVFRFFGERALSPDEGSTLLRQKRRRFLIREQGLSIAMGIALLISAAALLFKGFRKIKFWNQWYKDLDRVNMDYEAQWATEFLAWYGFSFYVIQAVARFVIARKLRRSIVWHAFVTSVISLIFLFVMGLSASYQKEWSWKAEPIAAIMLSFVNLFEGVRIVILHLDDMDTRLRFDSRA